MNLGTIDFRRYLALATLLCGICVSNVSQSQVCQLPNASNDAQQFLIEFDRVKDSRDLEGLYQKHIATRQKGVITLEEVDDLKRQVVKRFGARPGMKATPPRLTGEQSQSPGAVELTFVASYPEGRVEQIVRLVCEGRNWKVQGFGFLPSKY